MAFTVEDVQDLIRLLAAHPEWRAELRPLILGDELLALPQAMRQLTERVDALATRIDELAQAQARTEARVEELAQAQARTEARMEELAQAQARTEVRLDGLLSVVERLATEQRRIGDRLGHVEGDTLEAKVRERAPSYFARLVSKPRIVHLPDVGADEAVRTGIISDDDYDEIDRLDAIVEGRDPDERGRQPILLAVEVSAEIRSGDIQRARRRALLLGKLGRTARPVVAGRRIGPVARREAEEAGVLIRLVPLR